jgi:hypothetical protein
MREPTERELLHRHSSPRLALDDPYQPDSIKDKNGEKAIDFLDERKDKEIIALFRRAQAISQAHIAEGMSIPKTHVLSPLLIC